MFLASTAIVVCGLGWIVGRYVQVGSLAAAIPLVAKDVYDFQTLIAGVAAIFAAFIAARPVYKQLDRMGTQTEIMSRDILSGRLSLLEGRKAELKKATTNFLQNYFFPGISNDDPANFDIDSHLAFDAQHVIESIHRQLNDAQQRREDGELVQEKRKQLASSAEKLADYLDDIHSPDSRGNDEEISAAQREEMEVTAVVAKLEIAGHFIEFQSAADDVQNAFDQEIARVRTLIRQIDQRLLTQNVS
jgi:hypothetical protein